MDEVNKTSDKATAETPGPASNGDLSSHPSGANGNAPPSIAAATNGHSTSTAVSEVKVSPGSNGAGTPPTASVAQEQSGETPRRRPGGYGQRDLTTGSVPKNLAHLAWPQFAEGLLNVFDQIWDLFLAGQGFGLRAIAGIGVAQQYVNLFRTGRMGLDTATRAMISRAIGAGDTRLANHIALQGFTVNIVFSFTVSFIGIIFTDVLLRAIGVSDAVVSQATGYMRWQFVAGFIISIRMMTGATLQASGDTLTPMKAAMVERIIHLVLAPVFMFGWAGLPEFGVGGVAVANCVSNVVGGTMNVRSLLTGSSRLHLRLQDYQFDPKLIKRLVKIAMPASVNNIERAASQMLLVVLMAPFGDVALAAYAVTQRTQMIVNLGSMGIGNASGIIAGQNLGAGKVSRARETILWALGYVTVVKLILVCLLFAFPTTFISIFNDDPDLLDNGAKWLRIMLFGYFAMGPVQVLMQSFQTAGDTLMPMVTTLVAMWCVEVPFAIALSGAADQVHPLGLTLPVPTIGNLSQYGVAWAITIAAFFRMSVYLPYFIWGPWTKKRVLDGVDRTPAASH